jgi:hypothetical protein
MAVRTAVPCILLTRKRSQVQTLSRPPPFLQVTALPASSRSRSLPGWAALGPRAILPAERVWSLQARPFGHSAPHRPRSVVAAPGRMAAPHGAVRQHRAPASSPARAQSLAMGALPAVWPAWSAGRSLSPKHHPAQVRRPTLPRRPPHDLRRRCPHLCLIGPSTEPPGTGSDHRNSTRSSRDRCPAVPGVPHR